MRAPKTVPLTLGNSIQGLGSGFAADVGNLDMKLRIPMFRENMVFGYAIFSCGTSTGGLGFRVSGFRVQGLKQRLETPIFANVLWGWSCSAICLRFCLEEDIFLGGL